MYIIKSVSVGQKQFHTWGDFMFDQWFPQPDENVIIIASLRSLDWTVVDELRHIPAGRPGSAQDRLRIEYSAYRMLHRRLGSNLPARAALAQSVFSIRRHSPEFVARYDRRFFFENTASASALHHDPLRDAIEATAHSGGIQLAVDYVDQLSA